MLYCWLAVLWLVVLWLAVLCLTRKEERLEVCAWKVVFGCGEFEVLVLELSKSASVVRPSLGSLTSRIPVVKSSMDLT